MRKQVEGKITDKKNARREQSLMPAVLFIGLFFAALGVLIFILQLVPTFIIALYFIVSIVTYIAYAIDKSAARAGRWRTSEATLQLMSLFGGWPGALLAQRTLHHKSRKKNFLSGYKFMVFLNIVVTAWLLTQPTL